MLSLDVRILDILALAAAKLEMRSISTAWDCEMRILKSKLTLSQKFL